MGAIPSINDPMDVDSDRPNLPQMEDDLRQEKPEPDLFKSQSDLISMELMGPTTNMEPDRMDTEDFAIPSEERILELKRRYTQF